MLPASTLEILRLSFKSYRRKVHFLEYFGVKCASPFACKTPKKKLIFKQALTVGVIINCATRTTAFAEGFQLTSSVYSPKPQRTTPH